MDDTVKPPKSCRSVCCYQERLQLPVCLLLPEGGRSATPGIWKLMHGLDSNKPGMGRICVDWPMRLGWLEKSYLQPVASSPALAEAASTSASAQSYISVCTNT